jgi:hypothetical protein
MPSPDKGVAPVSTSFGIDSKVPSEVLCWLLRKEGTGLPPNHHEVVSDEGLVGRYGIRNGDPFVLAIGPPEEK